MNINGDLLKDKIVSFAKDLLKVAQFLNWQNVLFLLKAPGNKISLYHQYYVQAIQTFKEAKLCVRFYEFASNWNIENDVNLKDLIEQNEPAIIVFANRQQQSQIFERIGKKA